MGPVLITGATGFVGAELAKRLLSEGVEVHAVTGPSGGDRWRLHAEEGAIAWHVADITDVAAMTSLVREVRSRVVYHLATYYAVDSTGVDLSAIIDVNVKAGAVVVRACAAAGLDVVPQLVSAGTCAEFGDLRTPATEDSPLDPTSVYASTKAAQVLVMRQLARDEGVPCSILRLYNMYGPFEKPARLIPHVCLSLIDGRHVPLTQGEQAKDYSYLPDVVDAFMLAGGTPASPEGRVMNIGSGRTVSMRELVTAIAAHFPEGQKLLGWGEVPYRDNEMWFQGTEIACAQRELGWSPRHTLDQGVAETVAWYVRNRVLYT